MTAVAAIPHFLRLCVFAFFAFVHFLHLCYLYPSADGSHSAHFQTGCQSGRGSVSEEAAVYPSALVEPLGVDPCVPCDSGAAYVRVVFYLMT